VPAVRLRPVGAAADDADVEEVGRRHRGAGPHRQFADDLAETRDFDGTAVFIFQPAEEGLGGARAMLADGLFSRFPCDGSAWTRAAWTTTGSTPRCGCAPWAPRPTMRMSKKTT
jgi:hypothetical protein